MSAVLDALPSVVHLLRDEPAPVAQASGNALLRPEELAAVGAAMTALDENEAAQKSIDEQFLALRGADQTAATHAKRIKLTGDSHELKASHERLRATARTACLDALKAAAKRAAAEDSAASSIKAETSAKYEALGGLPDELVGTSHFDPMGLRSMVGSALAPEPQHRPRNCTVVPDRFQRDCSWTVDSPAHSHRVRSFRAQAKAELQAVSGGARWPF